MLVLALQFSKGNGRGRTLGGYLTDPFAGPSLAEPIEWGAPWAAGE